MNLDLKKSPYCRRQNGAIFAMIAAALTMLLLLAGVTIAIAQRSLLSRYLASLADSAALAGSSVLVIEKGCTVGTSSPPIGGTAGTQTCSSQDRWNSAPDFALRTLQSGVAPLGLFSTQTNSLASLTRLSDSITGTVFATAGPTPAVRAVVERGWWKGRTNSLGVRTFEFISLEDPAQYDYPGIPRVFRFNAVRVRVTAVPSRLPLVSQALIVTKESIATVNHDQEVPFAPFAVPLCALLRGGLSLPDNSSLPLPPEGAASIYSAYDICVADRLIAPTSRYCAPGDIAPSNGPGCRGVVPQFNWDPLFFALSSPSTSTGDPRQGEEAYWAKTDSSALQAGLGPRKSLSNVADTFCFWGSPRYAEPEDNFAFAAAPCPASGAMPVESDVTYSDILGSKWLKTDSRYSETLKIGDSVCPIPDGFTTSDSKLALWNSISNSVPGVARGMDAPYSANDPEHVSLNTSSAFLTGTAGFPIRNVNQFFTPVDPASTPCVPPAAPRLTTTDPTIFPRPRWPRDFGRYGQNDPNIPSNIPSVEGGTCNSVRTGWGFWNQFSQSGSANWYQRYAPPNYTKDPSTQALTDQQILAIPAWKTWVAIVADGRAGGNYGQACAGVARDGQTPPSSDPFIISQPYEVIGFLRLHVYDLDVSDKPPTFPDGNLATFGSTNTGSYTFRAYATMSPPGTGSDPYVPSVTTYNNPIYRWWFNRPDMPGNEPALKHCNVVRARLSCKQPPMPQTGGTNTLLAPRLVAAPPATATPVP